MSNLVQTPDPSANPELVRLQGEFLKLVQALVAQQSVLVAIARLLLERLPAIETAATTPRSRQDEDRLRDWLGKVIMAQGMAPPS